MRATGTTSTTAVNTQNPICLRRSLRIAGRLPDRDWQATSVCGVQSGHLWRGVHDRRLQITSAPVARQVG